MTWITAIRAVISIVAALVDYLKEKKSIDAATAEALAIHLQGVLDEIEKANKIRNAVKSDAVLRPDSVRTENDGFRRD